MRLSFSLRHTLTSLVIGVFVVLPFQHCDWSMGGGGLQASDQGMLLRSGNGEGYDGKLDFFVRRIPDHTCSGQTTQFSDLTINGGRAQIAFSRGSQCREMIDVPVSELDFSPNTASVVGYRDAIYTAQDSVIAGAGDSFTEAWCQIRSADETTVERDIVVSWREAGEFAEGYIFGPTGSEPPTRLKRTFWLNQVGYYSEVMSLKIQTLEKGDLNHRYIGEYRDLKARSSGTQLVTCRLGGQFDAEAPYVSYPQSNLFIEMGGGSLNFSPVSDRAVLGFTIDKPLPGGLEFDPVTGTVSGVPLGPVDREVYEVSAQYKFGRVVVPLRIGIGRRFQVNDLSMTDDADLQDHQCATVAGTCTIWAAMAEIGNSSLPGPTEIVLSPGVYQFTRGELEIQKDVVVVSPKPLAATLDGMMMNRLFKVTSGGALELAGVKVQRGRSEGFGGAIWSDGAGLIIRDSEFADNRGLGMESHGGAISMDSAPWLEVYRSRFVNNGTPWTGSDLDGGAITTRQVKSVVIRDSEFTGNDSPRGGAVHLNNPIWTATLVGNVFRGNRALEGGAIAINGGRVVIAKSVLTKNESVFTGGAIWAHFFNSVQVRECLIEANVAMSGAGLDSWGSWNSVMLIDNSDIKNNLHPSGPGLWGKSTIHAYGYDVLIRNSRVLNAPTSANCSTLIVSDFHGPGVRSIGGNVYNDQSCQPISSDRILAP